MLDLSFYCRVEKKSGMFSGAEEEAPREKALKKIQIEIVRNLKGRGRTNSPVRRSLKPYDTLVLPRRHDEGSAPLFDFIQALTETTKRIISMESGGDHRRSRSPLRSKNRSRSPLDNRRSVAQALFWAIPRFDNVHETFLIFTGKKKVNHCFGIILNGYTSMLY